jgi:probable H4MPT-linked C1 transfer pathway protein
MGMSVFSRVIGWDIGGVNTKAARVENGDVRAVLGRPFEVQRAPHELPQLLRELASEIGDLHDVATVHAVTMTAELSQMFRTKREGVTFVLDAVERAFPSAAVHVYTVDGRFLMPQEARQSPLDVAAANWAATARQVATRYPDALLIDIGTTTTDIVPIVAGDVVSVGRTDPARLASGELVYSGVLRTPTEAMADHVVVGGEAVGVSAEGFALAGDVHVWRGDLEAVDYPVPTPDGRPPTREFAGERLARVICADRELLDHVAVSALADSLASAQVARIARAIDRVHKRHPTLGLAVVTGLGAFIGTIAARACGLEVVTLAAELGDRAARCAPAVSVALLLERMLSGDPRAGSGESEERVRPKARSSRHQSSEPEAIEARVDLVVKIGGGLLSNPRHLDQVLSAVCAAARAHRLLVIPGGGPFADTVRSLERQLPLSDDAAHWMAVLGMDQYAHLITARLDGASFSETPHEIAWALDRGKVPVLAPSRWLRAADPLPHAWDVTSDSIAAWVAGRVGARQLVLVKPRGARPAGGALVDAHFAQALPAHVGSVIVAADQIQALQVALCKTA